ncbi:MAG: response regulator [Kiritimatiellia bacterium]
MARILIIDDEETVMETLRILVSCDGHEVIGVTDGNKALEIIRSDPALDLVMTDLRMSPVSGMDIMRELKNTKPDLPIIVVSAFCDNQTISEARALGCTTYLKKPFNIAQVLDAIKTALG